MFSLSESGVELSLMILTAASTFESSSPMSKVELPRLNKPPVDAIQVTLKFFVVNALEILSLSISRTIAIISLIIRTPHIFLLEDRR